MTNASGIYMITAPSGSFYIGSSVNMRKRKREHIHYLKKGAHGSPILIKVARKYGIEALQFSQVITCAPSMLLYYEQQFIDKLKPKYNICKVAGNTLGITMSAQARERMRGRVVSMEQKEASRRLQLGNTYRKGIPNSPLTREKISKSLTGRALSPEHKKAISDTNKGKECSEETRRKISKALTGRSAPQPYRTRESFSAAIKKGWETRSRTFTPEHKEKLKVARALRPPISEETRKKMSDAQKRRHKNVPL